MFGDGKVVRVVFGDGEWMEGSVLGWGGDGG